MSTAPLANPLIATPSRPLPTKVAIVGAGTIGPDIGYYLLSTIPEVELLLVDIAQEPLDKARERIEGYVQKGLARRKLSAAQAQHVQTGLSTSLDYGELADCDWVIEAATENLELKRKIFADIEAVVRPDALITSNTSSLPAARLFGGLEHRGRTTVTHFFAPAFRNPAVEVIRWEEGDPAVVEYLRWLFCLTGKVPLVTSDALCFMLDRVFDNWCNDAALLLDRASAGQIDSVAGELVHAGPFFVLNLANGNPIIVETNTLQMQEEGEPYRPAAIFDSVTTWRTIGPGQRVDVPADLSADLRDRLRGVFFSQSVDIIDRGIGDRADLDLGCVLALGFWRGPFQLMETLGDAEVQRILERYCEERPGMPAPRAELASYSGFHRHVLVDEIDGAVVLTLRRPQALNALDDAVTDELLAIIREREGDPAVTGFVLTGYGTRAFCAGADVGNFPSLLGDAHAAADFARDCSRLLVHLDGMSKPVVAALNGLALGGGLELALRCHSIVAARGASLQFPEVTLGIAPGIGALAVPYRRWPAAAPVFHDMLRLGRRLKATEALELGVVDALEDGYAELIQRAIARVKELAGGFESIPEGPVEIAEFGPLESRSDAERALSPEVIGIIEQAVRDAAAAPTFAEALEIGYRAFGATACTDSARERITAFMGSH